MPVIMAPSLAPLLPASKCAERSYAARVRRGGMADSPTLSVAARLTRLAVPIAFGRLGGIVMGVTDTVVVGQFAPSELAALGLGWTLNGPALLGGFGLLLGVQVLAARVAGEGNRAAAGA